MTSIIPTNTLCARYGFALRLNSEGDICSKSGFEINPLHIAQFLDSKFEQSIRNALVRPIDQVCSNKFNFDSSFMQQTWVPSYHSGASISAGQPEVSAGTSYGDMESKITLTYRTSDTPSDQNVRIKPEKDDLHNCFVWLRLNFRKPKNSPISLHKFKEFASILQMDFRDAIIAEAPKNSVLNFTILTIPSNISSDIVNAVEYGYSIEEIMGFGDDIEKILLDSRDGLKALRDALLALSGDDFDTSIPIRTGMGDTAVYIRASMSGGGNVSEPNLYFGVAQPPTPKNNDKYDKETAQKEACMRASAYLAEYTVVNT